MPYRGSRALARPLIVAVLATLVACGDDGLSYDGEAGQPTPASFHSWVPVIDVSAVSGDIEITGDVVVDSGAPFTVLDADVYAMEDGKRSADLRAFDLDFADYPIIVYDVFDQGTGAPDGLLGGDLLRHFAFSLDYRGDRVWLRDDDATMLPTGVEAASVDDTSSVAFQLRGGGRGIVPGECPGGCGTVSVAATRVLVQVELEGGAASWFLVDTGASATVLPESVITELGDPSRPKLEGVSVATVNFLLPAYFTRVSSMSLVAEGDAGDVARASQPILVIPGWDLFDAVSQETGVEVRGLIGGSFLRHFLTTIDYPADRLLLASYTNQNHVSAVEFVRVGFTMSPVSGQWIISDVYADTDAAAEGLVRGDVVVQVAGTDITGMDEAQVAGVFAGFGEGDEVAIAIQVGNGLQSVDVMVEDLLPAYE